MVKGTFAWPEGISIVYNVNPWVCTNYDGPEGMNLEFQMGLI